MPERLVPAILIVTTLVFTLAVPSAVRAEFLRGDSNGDDVIDVADAVFTLTGLFVPGSPMPTCEDASDANDDGLIDISDPVFTLGFLFAFGPVPPLPYPTPGDDPTADALTCGPSTGTILAFEILEAGTQSGVPPSPCVDEYIFEVISDDATWQDFWTLHSSFILPAPPAPVVDFTINNVFVVMRSVPTAGYAVALQSLVEYDDHLEATILTGEVDGCFVLLVCSAPFKMYLIPPTTQTMVDPTFIPEFPCL